MAVGSVGTLLSDGKPRQSLNWCALKFPIFPPFFPHLPHPPPPTHILPSSTVWQEPFVDVFRTFKVYEWKTGENVGSVHSAMDKGIGRKVLQITGTVPASNYVRVPKSRSASLNLVGRYVYVLFKPPRRASQVYMFHFDVRTQDGLTLRVSVSNMYTQVKVSPTVVQLPLSEASVPGGKWTLFVLDAAAVLDTHSTRVFHSLKAFQACSTILLRGVYTSFNLYTPATVPREMAFPARAGRSWSDLYSYAHIPVDHAIVDGEWDSVHPLPLSRPPPLPHPRSNDPAPSSSSSSPSTDEQPSSSSSSSSAISYPAVRSPKSGTSSHRPSRVVDVRSRRGHNDEDEDDEDNGAATTADLSRISGPDRRRRLAARSLISTIIPPLNPPRTVSDDSIIPADSPLLTLDSVIGTSPVATLFSPDGTESIHVAHNLVVASELHSVPLNQRVFVGHTAGIVSVDTSKNLLVSGQGGPEALIKIYDFATTQCLATLVGHAKDLVCVTVSSDESLLAAVGKAANGRLKIVVWDISRVSAEYGGGIPSVMATAHVDPDIGVLKFSPFGDNRLVSAGLNNIRFWRVKSGVLRSCPVGLEDHANHYFTDVAFEMGMLPPESGGPVAIEESVIGQRVFVSSDSGMVFQIAYGSVELEAIYQLHNGPINAIAVVEGYCVTGSDDHFLRLWPLDFSDFFLEAEHESPVTSVAISYDCLRIVCGTGGGTVGSLDILSQSFTTFIRSHTAVVTDVAMAPAAAEFATVSRDGTIRIWSLETHQQLVEFATGSEESATALAYHPTAPVVAVGFDSGYVRIFDIPSTSLLHEFKQHTSSVGCVAYARAADALFSASADGTLVKYAVRSAYHPTMFVAHFVVAPTGATPMAVAPDGALIAYSGPKPGLVTIAETESLRAIHTLDLGDEPGLLPHTIHFPVAMPHEVLIGTVDATLFRADASRGDLLSRVPNLHSGPISKLDVSANGQYLVSSSYDGTLKVRDYYSRAEPYSQTYINSPGYLAGVAFSQDNKSVVSVGAGGPVFVWEFSGDVSPEFGEWCKEQLQLLAQAEFEREEGDVRAHESADDGSSQGTLGHPEEVGVDDDEGVQVVEHDDPAFADVAIQVANAFAVVEWKEQTLPRPLAAERYLPPTPEAAALSPRLLLGYTGSMYGRGGGNAVWCESQGYIAYASGSAVILEDVGTKAQTHLWGHPGPVSVIVASPDGTLLASAPGTGDGGGVGGEPSSAKIQVWSVEDAVCRMSLSFHESGVSAMAFSPDGKYLVSLGVYSERSVAVWDLRSCSLVGSVTTEHPQHAIVWIPSASEARFVTVGGYSIQVFVVEEEDEGGSELAGPDPVPLPRSLQSSIFTTVAVDESSRRASRVARRVYAGTYDGRVAVFNVSALPNPEFLGSWQVNDEQVPLGDRQVCVLAWREDMLFTGSLRGELRAWALPEDPREAGVGGALVETLRVGSGPLIVLSPSRSGDGALVGSADGNLWFVNWPELTAIRLLSAHSDVVTSVAFANDAELVVSGSMDGSLRLWSHGRGSGPWEGVVQFQVASPGVGVTALAVSEVRRALIAGYSDGAVRVFDLGELALVSIFKVFADAPVTCLAVGGPGDSGILAGSGAGDVVIVDADNGSVLKSITEHAGVRIDAISLSPHDPELWLVCARDRRVSVWRMAWRSDKLSMVDWLTFAAPPPPSGEVREGDVVGAPTLAVFSPVEPDIVVYSGYGDAPTILLYSLLHEEVLRSLPLSPDVWPLCLSVIPGEVTPMVVVGVENRLLRLIDYWEGTFQDFVGHSGAVVGVAHSLREGGGGSVVSGSSAGDVCVWDVC